MYPDESAGPAARRSMMGLAWDLKWEVYLKENHGNLRDKNN